MELSLEGKGVLAQYIAKVFSHDEISIFAMKVGVNPKEKDASYTKRDRAIYIVNALSSDRLDIAVKAILNGRKGYLDYDDMFNEINLIFERTMSQKIDEEGNAIPIFDPILKIEEKQSYIEKKLVELGFTNSLDPYQDALKIYRTSAKGSIGLLRVAIDDLTKEILNKKHITPYQNFKDRLKQLEGIKLLVEISKIECTQCHHKKQNSEANFAYDFYSLLSHYGNHPSSVTDEMASWLYTSTSAFIWFILKRYENLPPIS